MTTREQQQELADRLAPYMFMLSSIFVVLLATLIVLWVDIPRVAELSVLTKYENDSALVQGLEDSDQIASLVQSQSLVKQTNSFGKLVQLSMFAIWPLFWLEYASSLWFNSRQVTLKDGGLIRLLACVIPPLRLATPSAARRGRIWLPYMGWQMPSKSLGRKLEHAFGKPMLAIALLILPILLVEYGLHFLVEEKAWLRLVLHVSTGFIWCAFTIEFLILISATDKKLAYIKTHWIDLVIILLPLISFLRSFRVLRLAKLAKVQKLARMSRIFRVRGLLMKALRAIMLFDVVHRLLRITPEKKLAKLNLEYQERLEELEELKAEIQTLESELRGIEDSNAPVSD